jgi:hypothetical protein|tara:strand:- start:389 stop:586 length:198 start_codon:yes stop_codon:yes gene_type:complete
MGRMSDLHIEMQESNMDRMNKDILMELEALISEISDPIQLRTLDRIGVEIKRLRKIISTDVYKSF